MTEDAKNHSRPVDDNDVKHRHLIATALATLPNEAFDHIVIAIQQRGKALQGEGGFTQASKTAVARLLAEISKYFG